MAGPATVGAGIDAASDSSIGAGPERVSLLSHDPTTSSRSSPRADPSTCRRSARSRRPAFGVTVWTVADVLSHLGPAVGGSLRGSAVTTPRVIWAADVCPLVAYPHNGSHTFGIP